MLSHDVRLVDGVTANKKCVKVSCLAAITPLIYAWQAQNTAGDTKKKCTSGMVFVGMCTGNIIGPLLFAPSQAPLYRPGLIAALIMFVTVGGVSA